MIESVEFKNFKALRDTTLPLGRFTLIVGPNGSGKSTVFQALQSLRKPDVLQYRDIVSASQLSARITVRVVVHWGDPYSNLKTTVSWSPNNHYEPVHQSDKGELTKEENEFLNTALLSIGGYAPDANVISQPAEVTPNIRLSRNGGNLAAVIDKLCANDPERFQALNEELSRWLPEFDRILLDTPISGHKSILLRTREGQYKIPAIELSQGTLLALALLTLAYIPDPPSIICIEEPDRGIHPRLLRNVQDALYRLSYPESAGEKREPVQVIATTHSPYLLDLYSDHPEDIVIANKTGQDVRFERLSDMPHIDEILQDSRLGDIWYTGILGGVPSHI